jgi:hypothetical protein
MGHSNRKSCVLSPEGERSTSRNIFFRVQDPSSLNLSVTWNRQNSFELTDNKHSLTTGKPACCKGDNGPPNLFDVVTVVQMRQNTRYELFVLSLQNFPLRPGTTAKNCVKSTRYWNKQTLQSTFGSQLYMLSKAISYTRAHKTFNH